MSDAWQVRGSYFEACNCEAACPCNFGSPPTEGECTALVAWHVDDGEFDGVKLDGLNAAMVVYAPGHMLQTKWQAALYLDERADERQRSALGRIFGGQAGGLPAQLGTFIGKVLGVAALPITYQSSGRTRSVRIGSIGEATITAIDGPDGGDTRVSNPPLNIAPGEALVVARSQVLRFADHAMNVEVSNKNGFYAPFAYRPD